VGQFYTVVVTASNSINTITGTTLVQINNLTPTLTAMSPTSTTSGLGSFTIVLTGTNFAAGSQIEWNGSASLITPSTISGGTVMTATVDAATYIPTPNTDYLVRVVAPSPPGPSLLQRRHSNALTFRRN
jgi:hypothetical protein